MSCAFMLHSDVKSLTPWTIANHYAVKRVLARARRACTNPWKEEGEMYRFAGGDWVSYSLRLFQDKTPWYDFVVDDRSQRLSMVT